MKIKARKRIVSLSLLTALFAISGCGHIEITSPSRDGAYITTPYTLKVTRVGCCRAGEGTFRAVLDEGRPGEQDLTSLFLYLQRIWTASDVDLPLGAHELSASADLERPPGWAGLFCWNCDKSDERNFFVGQPMCIRGKLLGYWTDPSQTFPLPDATISVFMSQNGQLVAEGTSDSDGNFCIDNIPVGFLLDISFSVSEPDWGCEGSKKDINPGLAPNTRCSDENCPDIGEIVGRCFPN